MINNTVQDEYDAVEDRSDDFSASQNFPDYKDLNCSSSIKSVLPLPDSRVSMLKQFNMAQGVLDDENMRTRMRTELKDNPPEPPVKLGECARYTWQ